MADAYIYDAVRTPRGKGRPNGGLHTITPVNLARQVLEALRDRNNLDTSKVDDIVLGCVSPVGEQGADIARVAAIMADYDEKVPGKQLNRFCASGLEAVNSAAAQVMSGQSDLTIGGGVESMSRVPMSSDGGAWATDPQVAYETYFDNAVAQKEDLVGELNKGWTVGKRLLQHERSGMESLVAGSAGGGEQGLVAEAKAQLGLDAGKIADAELRSKVLRYEMDNKVFRLAQRRAVEESDGGTPGPVTSIFKVYGSELQQDFYDLITQVRGVNGFAAPGEDWVSERELETTSRWLYYRAASIYSGSNEVQRNIIAKRVLGLPD